MDPHDPHHQESGSGFHNPAAHWGDANSPFTSHHQSPVNEYNSYSFSPVTMEPMFASSAAMPPPRTTSTHQQLQQLQPLIMPAPPWPSMLASQSTYAQPIYSATTMSCSPQALRTPSTPLSAPPTTGRQSNPRKTLTDADRKRMCLYAEEHPNVKQTEIGGTLSRLSYWEPTGKLTAISSHVRRRAKVNIPYRGIVRNASAGHV